MKIKTKSQNTRLFYLISRFKVYTLLVSQIMFAGFTMLVSQIMFAGFTLLVSHIMFAGFTDIPLFFTNTEQNSV